MVMKKDILYFVEDAYGYLISCDELSFDLTKNLWREHDCKFVIDSRETPAYISYRLWRV